MKKLLAALLLAAVVLASPSTAIPWQLAEVQIISVSQFNNPIDPAMVQEAFSLMQAHYSMHVNPGLVADYPQVIFVSDGGDYFGCYGMLCLESSWEMYEYYTNPELRWLNPVFINLGSIKQYAEVYDERYLRSMLIFVLAHEMGHHALTLSGVLLEDQHKLMACGSSDGEIIRVLGLEKIWDMETRCSYMQWRN